jgi:hypothetical protein
MALLLESVPVPVHVPVALDPLAGAGAETDDGAEGVIMDE